METMDDFKDYIDASFRKINEGDIITGTIIDVSEDGLILDLKYYTQGIIKARDLSNDPGFSIKDEMHVGDEITATVISTDDGKGNILLSLVEANNVLSWDKLKEYQKDETILSLKIAEAVNSGVIVYVEGIKGFIPASKLTLTYVEDVTSWVGKIVKAIIINIDENNSKLVLSAKDVEMKEKAKETSSKISMIVPGSIFSGTVETLMPYGAFISLDNGLSGLLHISRICQKRIKKPSEVLSEGQKVKVKVIDTKDGKLSLSMREFEESMEEVKTDEIEAFDYKETGSASTSLGDLLSKFNL